MTDNAITTLGQALQSPFPVIYLDFRSVDRFLYRISDLERLHDYLSEDLIERLAKCHLYMICKRPRLSLVPNTISWNAKSISLKVSCALNGVIHKGDVRVERPPELRDATAFSASPFPHRKLQALDEEGKVIGEMQLANYAHMIDSLPSFAKRLEVLYVGKGLAANTQDRLKNHGTLQKVLAAINSDDPDSEVFALVYRFDHRRSVGGLVTDKAVVTDFLRRNSNRYVPTLDDQVSLIEAATISYFKTTKYNSHYINFPSADTDAARRAREFGTAYIAIQIDNENIGGVQIYSQLVEPLATHYIVHRIAR
jgi:hypothetical protein